MQNARSPALRLLLACARAHPSDRDKQAILDLLDEKPDWTAFAQKARNHGLAELAGHTLISVASDRMPADIANAFRALIDKTRDTNRRLLEELFEVVDCLIQVGVEPICFKGPVLAWGAFGDLGLRGFRDLDILIRDHDLARALQSLQALGYLRNGKFTPAQFDAIHRLQGQEVMYKPDRVEIEPHTRLTPIKMALSVDYEGLWRRAQRQPVCGRDLLTFAPEDTVLVLAIHGGKELWWDIKWACDIADYVASHPGLDWAAILDRAHKQACHGMLLVAAALAHDLLGAAIPEKIVSAAAADRTVQNIIARIMARWEMDDPGGPPSNKTLSLDRLLLHDGLRRRAGYVLRTWLLPGPHHVSLIALPKVLNFAYIPIGLVHDVIALPLYRGLEQLRGQADRFRVAMATSPLALALTPVSAKTRKERKQCQQVYAKALRAVTADARNVTAWIAMGSALFGLRRFKQAVFCYDRSLAIVPDQSAVWKKREAAIAALRTAGDLPHVEDSPPFDSKSANGWAVRAGFLLANHRPAQASQASDRALWLDPQHEAATRIGIQARIYSCDWDRREADKRRISEGLKSGADFVKPVKLRLISDSEEEALSLARLAIKRLSVPDEPLWCGERYHHDKIRIAYLSTDLRAHVVGTAIVGCLEHHDKSRFEITAISLNPGDGSDMRQRIETAVDRFVDAHDIEDATIAAMLRQWEIDIAIDLNGLSGTKRLGILARRPAPLQVNYLGYPGTMGATFIDYIIADHTIIPEGNGIFYTEKAAYLPNSYLPWDSKRIVDERTPTRSELGLPEHGFVFACFNNLYKLTPEIFDVWMRLLQQTEGSVLWLGGSSAEAKKAFRRRAQFCGVAPERLVFSQFVKRMEEHQARQRVADLFLDTLPYGAHSTGIDALWIGLPLLTCLGKAFPGRVAASLLHTIGLPELVTTSLAEYEERALALARDPRRLAALRQKLAYNRHISPLFDTASFTRDLESLYAQMWKRQQSGLPPESFSIAAKHGQPKWQGTGTSTTKP